MFILKSSIFRSSWTPLSTSEEIFSALSAQFPGTSISQSTTSRPLQTYNHKPWVGLDKFTLLRKEAPKIRFLELQTTWHGKCGGSNSKRKHEDVGVKKRIDVSEERDPADTTDTLWLNAKPLNKSAQSGFFQTKSGSNVLFRDRTMCWCYGGDKDAQTRQLECIHTAFQCVTCAFTRKRGWLVAEAADDLVREWASNPKEFSRDVSQHQRGL